MNTSNLRRLVIMAGGEQLRFSGVKTPKSLMPIPPVNVPILVQTYNNLKMLFHEVVIVTPRDKDSFNQINNIFVEEYPDFIEQKKLSVVRSKKSVFLSLVSLGYNANKHKSKNGIWMTWGDSLIPKNPKIIQRIYNTPSDERGDIIIPVAKQSQTCNTHQKAGIQITHDSGVYIDVSLFYFSEEYIKNLKKNYSLRFLAQEFIDVINATGVKNERDNIKAKFEITTGFENYGSFNTKDEYYDFYNNLREKIKKENI